MSKQSVKTTPKGYHSMTPIVVVKDMRGAIDFYKSAFGAEETICMKKPDGSMGHVELKIGDSNFMLCDEMPDQGAISPETAGGCTGGYYLYVEKVDDVAAQAEKAGAKVAEPVQDMFYGDRAGMFKDPFGHHWWIATHIEDVEGEELNRRAEKAYQEMAAKKKAA